MGRLDNLINRKNLFILIVVEVLLILIMTICGLCFNKNDIKRDINLADMNSNSMTYQDGHWVIEEYDSADGSIVSLYGGRISLPKGSYTLNIRYKSANENLIFLYSENNPDSIIASNYRLENCNEDIDCDFRLIDDVDDLEIRTIYTCEGYLEIDGFTIRSNSNDFLRMITITIMLFAILDMLLAFIKPIFDNKMVTAILFTGLVITSAPLIFKDILVGHDLPIHLMRIEGIKTELLKGIFPVRMQSMWFGGYGYPISVYYGDWSLYFPAFLRMAGFSINESWKLFVLFTNILTICVGYKCFYKIYSDKNIAAIVTLAYASGTFRIVDIFVRSSAGEMVAFIFMPVIAMAVYGIYTDDISGKGYNRNAVFLAIGMTGLITTHILTTEIVVICLLIICLVLIKQTLQIKRFICYLKAVGLTLLMSAGFLIPFFEYFLHNKVIINDSSLVTFADNIQENGAYLWDYFDFFGQYIGGFGGNPHGMNMTSGLLSLVTLCLAIHFCYQRKASFKIKLLSGLSIFVFFISSNIFPWNFLGRICGSVNTIQYPWRFLFINVLLLALLLGEILPMLGKKDLFKKVVALCILLPLITGAVFMFKYVTTSEKKRYFADTHTLSVQYVSGGEYIIQNTDLNNLIFETEVEGDTITLPVFNYPHYKVTDANGKNYEIVNGSNNRISIKNFDGDISDLKVNFVEPIWWRLSELITVITIIFMLIYLYKSDTHKTNTYKLNIPKDKRS